VTYFFGINFEFHDDQYFGAERVGLFHLSSCLLLCSSIYDLVHVTCQAEVRAASLLARPASCCVAFADRKVRGLRPLCRRRYRYALSKPQSGSAVNRIFGGFSSIFAA